jgi:hypothetical protein
MLAGPPHSVGHRILCMQVLRLRPIRWAPGVAVSRRAIASASGSVGGGLRHDAFGAPDVVLLRELWKVSLL